MILLLIPLGLILPTICGWLMLKLVEGKHPVLLNTERWFLGFLLGITGTMYITVLVHIAGAISFTRLGFATVQILLTIALAGAWYLRKMKMGPVPAAVPEAAKPFSRRGRIILGIAGTWMGAKILSGFLMLVTTPVYLDDVFNNWNMRGKLFFIDEKLSLTMQSGNEQLSVAGIHSYPPTVPMVKTWMATLAGSWNEGLVNGVHMLWYICVLGLVYFFLRRSASRITAIIGTYVLGSIPLLLLHGSNPYADVFIAAHIFAAVSLLVSAVSSEHQGARLTFLRLSAVTCALLIFTKNEGLVLHLPPIALLTAISLFWMLRTKRLTLKEATRSGFFFLGCIAAVAIPWILFKWFHGLPFGNAKPLSSLDFSWQENVLYAISINTFFEGNWLLLYPFLIGLFIACWKKAFRSPAVIFSAFFLIVYLGQLPLYLFTGLSTEALMQTGYARGLLQLAPIAVVLMILLGEDLVKRKNLMRGNQ